MFRPASHVQMHKQACNGVTRTPPYPSPRPYPWIWRMRKVNLLLNRHVVPSSANHDSARNPDTLVMRNRLVVSQVAMEPTAAAAAAAPCAHTFTRRPCLVRLPQFVWP